MTVAAVLRGKRYGLFIRWLLRARRPANLTRTVAAAAMAAAILGPLALGAAAPAGAAAAQLIRYPYLTDVVSPGGSGNATMNWATDQSQTTGYATYGVAGTESCTAHRANASKTNITVGSTGEEQWKAKITGLVPNTRYCYRVFFSNPTVDLLGSDASPQFWSMPAAGSEQPFSFAVTGDWGMTDANGNNPDQANLERQIAASGARFILGAGDTAYNSGSETNYGDLYQRGADVSDVFGPAFYKNVGASLPMFNALGNHGRTATFPLVWPEAAAAAASGGTYAMQTYCCVNGTASASYPSAWYAFDAGPARIYVLDATWSNGNLGNGTLYSDDDAAHWSAGSAEYQWLAADLAAHPSGLKFAVMHFPMYSDSSSEGTDPYLHGAGSVGALLSQYGAQFVFNGHAHIYERNTKQPRESFVSYVAGGGGATLEPVGTAGCASYDAYAIGWSPTKLKGYKCGSAPLPTSASSVFSFLLVTVNGNQVTITPTDELGRTFDVQTYSF
jgi:purple acid phosphatase-like protein/calcineurin-like phosphoesterase family protein